MKQFVKEFREFAIKGNVLDLAVGVIIGTAFGKIISSFVNDVVLAPLSFVLGKVNFDNYFLVLSGGEYATLGEAKAAGAVTINYGAFATTIIDFLILAFIIFLLLKQLNRLRARIDKLKNM